MTGSTATHLTVQSCDRGDRSCQGLRVAAADWYHYLRYTGSAVPVEELPEAVGVAVVGDHQ
jgi:hypothetical protein